MKSLYLKYNRVAFWKKYWEEFDVDYEEFIDLNVYPIERTLKYVRKTDKVLECGFGGGRIIRHLTKYGYDIEGIEHERGAVEKLKSVDDRLKITCDDILNMDFADNRYDVALCFGVIGGLYDNTARAIWELKRVTKNGGTILISVMLDNLARKMQKHLSHFSDGEEEFYAWMDSKKGWENYFKTFGLYAIGSQEVVRGLKNSLDFQFYDFCQFFKNAR